MNSIDIAVAIDNGKPGAASEERARKRRLRTLQDLWVDCSFQIVVVFIAILLLIYTIIGKYNNRAEVYKRADYRTSWR